jgi:hypothetical protein
VLQVYTLLYEKILEAPIWPLSTQRIESAMSVWQGARCHWPLIPTLQDTQRAAVHSAARSTPPQQPSPFPTAWAATPWMEWIRNVLLQPTHTGPGIPGYHTHYIDPSTFIFPRNLCLTLDSTNIYISGTLTENFSLFNFIFQITLSNYVLVRTPIKYKYLNDTNILFNLSKPQGLRKTSDWLK